MKEVNLDFSSAIDAAIIHPVHSINSSPIIERIDLNGVFNKIVINTAPIIESMDSNSLSINSNRNSLTLNTSIDLLRSQSRNKELLNYQSNILYLLINNLSPSIY
jgi:predicted glycosyltransferase involved in capsule biosynthesis